MTVLRRMVTLPEGLSDEVVGQVERLLRFVLPPSEGSASTLAASNPSDIIDAEPLPPAADFLTRLGVSYTDDAFVHSPVPPWNWLLDLGSALKERKDSGDPVISIQHPTVYDLRVPPWAIHFWDEYLIGIRQRNLWVTARESVERSQRERGVDGRRARLLMDRIPWQMGLWCEYDGLTLMGILAEILTPTSWIRERHIDAFVTYLNFHGKGRRWLILKVHFSTIIRKLGGPARISTSHRRDKSKSRSPLDLWMEEVTSGDYDHLVFPANINNNHWIVFEVDFKEGWFRHGELPLPVALDGRTLTNGPGNSLEPARRSASTSELCTGLARWLNQVFNRKFEDLGRRLPTGRQADSNSCGICVLNAMECLVIGGTLFTQEEAIALRTRYFSEIVEHLLEHVSDLLRLHFDDTVLSSCEVTTPHPRDCAVGTSVGNDGATCTGGTLVASGRTTSAPFRRSEGGANKPRRPGIPEHGS